MNFRKCICVLLLLAAPLLSHAFTPETGFYYMYTSDNKQLGGGTGLAVDIQNEYLFAAGYIYSTSGTPEWVTLQGPLKLQSDGSWQITQDVFTAVNGQCVDTIAKCPYKKPTMQTVGKFTLTFAAENIGLMTWGATGTEQSVTLERSAFLAGDAPGSLVGEWDAVFYNGSNPTTPQRFFADKIMVQLSKSGSIVGCLALGEAESGCGSGTQLIPLLGNYKTSTGAFGPSTVYQLAVFDNALNNIQRVYTFTENGFGGQFTGTIKGTVNICASGTTYIVNCTAIKNIPFVAYRSASANYVTTGQGMD